jgi:hypothetical protein
MMSLLWFGVLLDYAAFTSPLPGFVQNHKSLLFGDTYPEVVEAVQATYAAAWPPILVALASSLPSAKELAAAARVRSSSSGQQEQQRQASWSSFVDAVSSGGFSPVSPGNSTSTSPGKGSNSNGISQCSVPGGSNAFFCQQLQLQSVAMHGMLVDVSLMLLCDTASTCAAALVSSFDSSSTSSGDVLAAGDHQDHLQQLQVPWEAVMAARRMAVVLQALQLLLSEQHCAAGLVAAVTLREVAAKLSAMAREVLGPWTAINISQQQQQQQQQEEEEQARVVPALTDIEPTVGASGGMVDSTGRTLLSTIEGQRGSVARQGSAAAASAKGSSVDPAAANALGLVLVAAADLLQSLVQGLAAADSSSSSDEMRLQLQDAGLVKLLLEALVALSSIAVPYQTYTSSNSSSGSAGATAVVENTATVRYLPAVYHVQRQQQQQQQQQHDKSAAASDGSFSDRSRPGAGGHSHPTSCSPGLQSSAACVELCQAAATLQQQQVLQTQQASGGAGAVTAAADSVAQVISSMGLRLLMTAAPGHQLEAARKLVTACWAEPSTAAAATAALGSCEELCLVVAAAVEQLCGSCRASCSAGLLVVDAAARLPVLLTGMLSAAAGCCKGQAAGWLTGAAAATAVEQCCGVLLWVLQQQQQEQQPAAAAEGGAFVACKVLEALRVLLQEAAVTLQQQQQPLTDGKVQLAQQVMAAVTPQVRAAHQWQQ